MTSDDKQLQKMARRRGSRKARTWLRTSAKSKEHTLGLLTSTIESLELVEQLFKWGAVEVIACEIDSYVWGENTGKLVIALPRTPAKRKKIFHWSNKISSSLGFDPTPDVGQTYLFVMLD